MRVFLDSSPTIPGHSVRGMGRYASQILQAIKSHGQVQLVGENDRPEIIHYPYFDLFFNTLPTRGSAPTVVTVHDTHPLIYPEHFPVGIRGKLRFAFQKKRLQKADAIIVNTETTKKDVVRFLDIFPDRVFVTHFAPSSIYTPITHQSLITARKRYNLPERFVLYVGDINYNKNIPGLIRAFSLLTHHPSLITHLVFVGKAFENDIKEAREIRQLVEGLGIKDRVHILGFAPDEDLVKIYNLAKCYCQPSFYEGFGFPVLEAMACGVPVVAGKTQALVEIGEGAALFVNPKDVQDMASGLGKVINESNLRKNLIAAGTEKVKIFSWGKTADATVNVYKKVLGQ